MSERPSLPSHSLPQNLLSFAGEQLQEGWAHVSCCLSVMNDLDQFLSAFHANRCFDSCTADSFAATSECPAARGLAATPNGSAVCRTWANHGRSHRLLGRTIPLGCAAQRRGSPGTCKRFARQMAERTTSDRDAQAIVPFRVAWPTVSVTTLIRRLSAGCNVSTFDQKFPTVGVITCIREECIIPLAVE